MDDACFFTHLHSDMTDRPTTVLVLFGTRPELIKLAPVIKRLRATPGVQVQACSTGQHREMLRQVMDIFGIELDHDLDLMKPNQDLFDLSAHVLVGLREVFTRMKPDCVVVQGDTTTAFIASLAAFYLRIRVAHVEAGLRSHNLDSPYPEEANRRFVSVVARYHFAPTPLAKENLLREGFPDDRIWVTGNTVVDALDMVKESVSALRPDSAALRPLTDAVPAHVLAHPYILVTLHRREKFGKQMLDVLECIKELALKHPDQSFIYPLHLNPNVFKPANDVLGTVPNVHLIPPQDYLIFNVLMANCHFIMSDSGGIQEEAFTYRKPIIVMRDVTERMEAIHAGYAFLVGQDPDVIKERYEWLDAQLRSGTDFFTGGNPYGDGRASERIVSVITQDTASDA